VGSRIKVTKSDWAYIAGFFDGDGSLSDFYSDPVSTDPERGRSADRRITRRLLSWKARPWFILKPAIRRRYSQSHEKLWKNSTRGPEWRNLWRTGCPAKGIAG